MMVDKKRDTLIDDKVDRPIIRLRYSKKMNDISNEIFMFAITANFQF